MSNTTKPISQATLRQIEEKLRQAMALEYAEVTLIIKNGRLAFIRGPAPVEKVKD